MDCKTVNIYLRSAVNNLISKGWPKTNVGKTLLGDNGQGHVNHWLKQENGKTNDFGIKPLTNIANQIGYDVHIVFLPQNGKEKLIEELDTNTLEFINELSNAIDNYLSNAVTAPKFINRQQSKNKIDAVLDGLLEIDSDDINNTNNTNSENK